MTHSRNSGWYRALPAIGGSLAALLMLSSCGREAPSPVAPEVAVVTHSVMSDHEKDKGRDKKLTLSVQIAGRGDGTVKSTGRGVDCDHDCKESFAVDAVVELKATARDGSTFKEWTGPCVVSGSDSSTCTVTMDADKSVTATFTRIPKYDLTVTLAGNGTGMVTSEPHGISCGGTAKHGGDDDKHGNNGRDDEHGNKGKDDEHGGNCHESFLQGSVVLTAAGTGGSAFLGWGGACSASGTLPTCTVTLTADATVTATFGKSVLLSVTTTVTGNGTGTGSVTSSVGGIACPGTCSASIASGTSDTLTATAGAGASFASWSGGSCSGTSPTCILTMNAARSVTATFQSNTVTVTTGSETGSGGYVSSNPAGINNCTVGPCVASFGSSVVLTAHPDAGSLFSWTGACSGILLLDCTLGVDAAKTVGVSFAVAPTTKYTMTVEVSLHGDVLGWDANGINFNDCYDYGGHPSCTWPDVTGDITLTTVPDDGFKLIAWGGACSGSGACVVTMDGNKTVTATFGPVTTASLARSESGLSPLRGINSAGVTTSLSATRSAFIEQQR